MIFKGSIVRTAIIPVRFVDGTFVNLITKEPLKELRNNSTFDLVVDAYEIADPALLSLLNDEREVDLLPAGEILLANISDKSVPDHLSKFTSRPDGLFRSVGGLFVEIHLETQLGMLLRGTKTPALSDCRCFIPALNETAASINHAYTLISTAFEPDRRSHTGNVFDKVFYFSKHRGDLFGSWAELRLLRDTNLESYFDDLSEEYQSVRRENEPDMSDG